MTADFGLLVLAAVLGAVGAYLMLERTVLKILLGIIVFSNGVNLLLLAAGGRPSPGRDTDGLVVGGDTLASALILTSIVITAGVSAFVLALAYRSYQVTTREEIGDDPEDARIKERSSRDAAAAPDRDRSDNPVTGAPTAAGDHVEYEGRDPRTHEGVGEDDGRDHGAGSRS